MAVKVCKQCGGSGRCPHCEGKGKVPATPPLSGTADPDDSSLFCSCLFCGGSGRCQSCAEEREQKTS